MKRWHHRATRELERTLKYQKPLTEAVAVWRGSSISVRPNRNGVQRALGCLGCQQRRHVVSSRHDHHGFMTVAGVITTFPGPASDSALILHTVSSGRQFSAHAFGPGSGLSHYGRGNMVANVYTSRRPSDADVLLAEWASIDDGGGASREGGSTRAQPSPRDRTGSQSGRSGDRSSCNFMGLVFRA